VTQKHHQWFYKGADTLSALVRARGIRDAFPTSEHWYLCPLCLDGFTIEELTVSKYLTVEHVPPEQLGGHELILTCRRCNNSQGSAFDAHAHKQQEISLFLSGKSESPQRAKLTFGDITTTVDMYVNGRSGMLFVEIPNRSDPEEVRRMNQLAERRETPSDFDGFTIVPRLRYNPDRARISWIRTAYLAAFALFGWSYILQPSLDPIRDQLQNPSANTLPLLSSYNPAGDPERHELWVIKKPTKHRSVLVIYGRQAVFLPLWSDPRTLDELAQDIGSKEDGPVHYAFTGDMFHWPSEAMYLLDESFLRRRITSLPSPPPSPE
jgi:hypothetical protein